MAALSNLLPLLILLLIITIGAFIGYQIYTFSSELASRGSQHMSKKNVVLSKDGATVGVKGLREGEYEDRTQSVLVKAWNTSSWPAYKSRFWNKEGQGQGQDAAGGRTPYSARTASLTGGGPAVAR